MTILLKESISVRTVRLMSAAGWLAVRALGLVMVACLPAGLSADPVEVAGTATPSAERPFYIREFRVLGVSVVPKVEVEKAVYPFMGPLRTSADVEQARAAVLYTAGSLPLALFTGDWTNDVNKTVWAIGRNTDAGQRFGAYTEAGLGTTTQVKVWQPTIVGATTGTGGIIYGGTATSHQLWPAETVGGIYSPLGSGGYSSGALVADKLTLVLGPDAYKGAYFDVDSQTTQYLYPNATAGYYIGYVTPSDGNPRILGTTGVVPVANRGVALSWNGVALTDDNVRNGRYTAWLYNRILKPQTGLSGLKLTFANSLRDQIKNTDAVAGGGLLNDASFKVQRYTDGGLVVPK